MSRRHQPGRRSRKRKRDNPEVIILAPRQTPRKAPQPDDYAQLPPTPERQRDRRAEVLEDIQEEIRRWR
jgi:hypothetical protein